MLKRIKNLAIKNFIIKFNLAKLINIFLVSEY